MAVHVEPCRQELQQRSHRELQPEGARAVVSEA